MCAAHSACMKTCCHTINVSFYFSVCTSKRHAYIGTYNIYIYIYEKCIAMCMLCVWMRMYDHHPIKYFMALLLSISFSQDSSWTHWNCSAKCVYPNDFLQNRWTRAGTRRRRRRRAIIYTETLLGRDTRILRTHRSGTADWRAFVRMREFVCMLCVVWVNVNSETVNTPMPIAMCIFLFLLYAYCA